MEEKSSFNVKFLIMGICFSLLTLGVVDHVWNIDENLCEMTYMWEPPSYIVSIAFNSMHTLFLCS